MNDLQTEHRSNLVRKIALALLLSCLLAVVGALAGLKWYLGTPAAAARLSRYLTSYLHQEVKVSSLATSGGTLYLRGISIANPTDFPRGNLAAADSLAIAPAWFDLLWGHRRLHLLELDGVTLE